MLTDENKYHGTHITWILRYNTHNIENSPEVTKAKISFKARDAGTEQVLKSFSTNTKL